MRPDDRPQPGRRALLAAVLGIGGVGLAGCGIRLEDDASRVPLVPARTPVPAEDLLVALTVDSLRLATLAGAVAAPLGPALATIHRRQHTVLRTTLLRGGVPATTLDAASAADPSSPATPSPTPSPTVTGTPEPSLVLARAEAAAAAGAGRFAGVDESLLAPVAALHAQRFAAATLLTGRAPTVPTARPDGDAAADLAAATSAATYLVEVAAARSSGAARERAVTTLTALRALHADQVAGNDHPRDVLGVPLPFPVRSPADASRLVTTAVTDLRTTTGAALPGLTGTQRAAGLAAATRWLGTVEVEAHRWGVPLAPFPGLT
ncbi:DUF4439 domain-containing protein [Nostocoides sp. Soil756]|uniref:DUF4439 domain-containing protein n=1 Tax=Nostocoides sp. Soil756 TaxID=1736399 RepID=UPI0006F3F32B|nr:DUF4439 domain-containing protein [Tetrasphaera sp. Soil756]KRE61622.1 hypothetical protein ASG78_09745 [Tetrasphaera sp. Soil756]